MRRPSAAVLVATAALLASGCSGDRARPDDSLPPLPSTSATASPTEPEDAPGAEGYPLPEEARAYTPEGARAFFDYFIAVHNASVLASDPAPLREITQGCEYCDDLTQRLAETAAAGLTVVGGELVLTEVGDFVIVLLESGAEGAGVVFRLVQRPYQVFDTSGSLISDAAELHGEGTVELAWLSDQRDWLVSVFSVDLQ
ncbi:MAG: DUF6318 family protein [Actinomycetota bacterium]|nr:DUF6318 family protein [Actinomycetota bacterium]